MRNTIALIRTGALCVVLSIGQDTGDVSFQVRNEMPPNGARLRTAGRGITMPNLGAERRRTG